MAFQDHFSARAAEYARSRPDYPPELFTALAEQTPGRSLAWDCGTGNGQAARGLAVHFESVVATDPSAPQLERARPHPRITYRQAGEGDSGLESGTADLVSAAQAAHWFDPARFTDEAARVLRPGGVLAVWCYGLCRIGAEVNGVVEHFYFDTVGRWWPPERRMVDEGYRSMVLPFPEISIGRFSIRREWSLAEFLAYVRTWSAVERGTRASGRDPTVELERSLMPLWRTTRPVEWPLHLRACRKP